MHSALVKPACSHLKVQEQLLRRSCNSRDEEAYVRMLDLQAVLPVRRQHVSIVPDVPHLQNTHIAATPQNQKHVLLQRHMSLLGE